MPCSPFRRRERTLSFAVSLIACSCADSPPSAPSSLVRGTETAVWPQATPFGGDDLDDGRNPWQELDTGGSGDEMRLPGRESQGEDEPKVDRPGPGDEKEAPDDGVDEPPQKVPELVFRRYLEGAGSEKRLSLSGPQGVSRMGCAIEIYSNGGTEPWRRIEVPLDFPASGTIEMCSPAIVAPDCTHELSGSMFNGNDALVLRCGDAIVDSIGRVGEDPGRAWRSETADGPVSTEGQHLLRCDDYADIDPFDEYRPSVVWVAVRVEEPTEEALSRCPTAPGGVAGAGGGLFE